MYTLYTVIYVKLVPFDNKVNLKGQGNEKKH